MESITAIATAIMAAFTGCLWWSTKKLWETTEKSIELAREEFIATHRPKLRVHSISFTYNCTIEAEGWNVQYLIDNIGESSAIINKCKFTFKKLKEPFPVHLPFSDESPLIEKVFIKSGESTKGSICQFDKETRGAVLFHKTALDGGSQGRNSNDLYFFGYIDYTDNIGTNRRTAFCRQYNIKTRRFTKVEDEDYEYSY